LTVTNEKVREQRDLLQKRLAGVPWLGDAASRLQNNARWVQVTLEHFVGDLERMEMDGVVAHGGQKVEMRVITQEVGGYGDGRRAELDA